MANNLRIGPEWVTIDDVRRLTRQERAAWSARWPHFPAWPGGGDKLHTDDFSLRLRIRSLDRLETLRVVYGRPLRVNCAYRNEAHNRRVKGGSKSQHKEGRAFDLDVPGNVRIEGPKLEAIAKRIGFTAIGRYPKSPKVRDPFIHVDDRQGRGPDGVYRWGSKSWR